MRIARPVAKRPSTTKRRPSLVTGEIVSAPSKLVLALFFEVVRIPLLFPDHPIAWREKNK